MDFKSFFPYVVPEGIVAFHDVHIGSGPVGWPGVLKVWEEVALPLLSQPGTCSSIGFGRKASQLRSDT